MFPHGLTLPVTWTRGRRRISSRWRRSRGPESTRSSIKHVRDMHVKWSRSRAHRRPRGFINDRDSASSTKIRRPTRGRKWSVRFSSNALVGFAARSSSGGRHQAVDSPHDWAHWIGRSRSSTYRKCHRTVQTSRGRTPRSRSDRATIAARSSRDRTSFIAESIHDRQTTFAGESGARSTPDRGPIVAQSWSIMAKIVAMTKWKSWQN